ncbi:large ribosomal subunit protein mL45 [Culicoides brevitarsis]|uniref:large ribosomal subunit protein mL45 n=1 Tax=Culicoides brevitarsis TaxID=469753 RepID=UPI00307B4E46
MSNISLFKKSFTPILHHVYILKPFLYPMLQNVDQVRHVKQKHWAPKFKKLRTKKFIAMDIPNLNEKESELSEEQMRAKMKERGLNPPRPWMERPFNLTATSDIFEAYVPPEGDGKISSVTTEGAKQKLQFLEKKSKSYLAVRKIRSYEEDFDTNSFVQQAQDIYISAHEALAKRDKYQLREFVTEKAYLEMMHNTTCKTICWRFLKSLEPPRLVHARCTSLIDKENAFGQVTVRFHTQQTLAIYDRFGRLMHGSEILTKDVLEYVVFEKHLANEYGSWRLHAKIIPEWMPSQQSSLYTYKNNEKKSTENEEKTFSASN